MPNMLISNDGSKQVEGYAYGRKQMNRSPVVE